MKRRFFLVPTLLLLGAMAAPSLEAQGRNTTTGKAQRQGQHDRLRMRDGSCTQTGQAKRTHIRKQDGTGPRGGTEACPQTPKATTQP